jgi:hypothetical protein
MIDAGDNVQTVMRRAAVHVALIGSFLFALALSASPSLHERFHPDANQPGHECVVTLIASGSYDHVAPPVISIAPALVSQFSEVPALNPVWVASPFSRSCVFEHAPPIGA